MDVLAYSDHRAEFLGWSSEKRREGRGLPGGTTKSFYLLEGRRLGQRTGFSQVPGFWFGK